MSPPHAGVPGIGDSSTSLPLESGTADQTRNLHIPAGPGREMPQERGGQNLCMEQVNQHQGHKGENELLSWKLTSPSVSLSLSSRQEPGAEVRDAARLKIQTSPRSPQPAGPWEGLCPSLASPTHPDVLLLHREVVPALLSDPSSSLPGPSQGKCRIQLCSGSQAWKVLLG